MHKHAASRCYTPEIFYTHIEGEAIARVYKVMDDEIDGPVINPAGFLHSGLRRATVCVRSNRRWSKCA